MIPEGVPNGVPLVYSKACPGCRVGFSPTTPSPSLRTAERRISTSWPTTRSPACRSPPSARAAPAAPSPPEPRRRRLPPVDDGRRRLRSDGGATPPGAAYSVLCLPVSAPSFSFPVLAKVDKLSITINLVSSVMNLSMHSCPASVDKSGMPSS